MITFDDGAWDTQSALNEEDLWNMGRFRLRNIAAQLGMFDTPEQRAAIEWADIRTLANAVYPLYVENHKKLSDARDVASVEPPLLLDLRRVLHLAQSTKVDALMRTLLDPVRPANVRWIRPCTHNNMVLMVYKQCVDMYGWLLQESQLPTENEEHTLFTRIALYQLKHPEWCIPFFGMIFPTGRNPLYEMLLLRSGHTVRVYTPDMVRAEDNLSDLLPYELMLFSRRLGLKRPLAEDTAPRIRKIQRILKECRKTRVAPTPVWEK
jgi:hypothetical protein